MWFILYLTTRNVSGGEEVNKKKIGQTLTSLRGDTPREEIAKQLGISVSTWQMYENGQRVPKDEIKIKIASYFKKSVGEIFYT